MAINGMGNMSQYFKYMSSANSITSSLSSQTLSSLNSFVYGQMNNSASQVQNMLSTNFNKYQSNVNSFLSFQKEANNFNEDFSSAASSLKNSALALNNYAKFGTGNSSAGSTNTGVLSVMSGNIDKDKTFDVKVQSLATSQTMKSGTFASSLGYSLGGTSSLKITSGGKTETLSFSMSNSISNKDALTQMASKINDADLGVKASVITKNGMSSLQMESKATGEGSAFTASFTGNAEKLNMETTQSAQNAEYSVDGTQYSSAKNELMLGETGIKAQLSGVGDAKIQQSNNSADMVTGLVKNFIQDYNRTVGVLKANSGKTSAVRELAQSYASVKFQAAGLNGIGISTKSDGTLTLDSEKLTSALKSKPENVQETLGKLASSTQQRTQTALADKNKLFNAQSFAAQDFGGGMYNSFKQFYNNPYAAQNVINMML